jgi:hypothetical protein
MKVLGTVLLLAIILAGCVRKSPNAAALVPQLQGTSCSFLYDFKSRRCEAIGLLAPWVTRNFKYRCIADAARCLGALKIAAGLPELMLFLQTGMNDVDTGDGILAVRGAVAEAAADLGDPRALSALEKALERNDEAARSENGAFPPGYLFQRGTSHPAILKAIEKLRGK